MPEKPNFSARLPLSRVHIIAVMPIRSRADYLAYLAADLAAHHRDRWSLLEGWRNPVLGFQRLLRRAEYVANCKPGPLWRIRLLWLKWRLRRRSFLLGFNIPINVFGPGLCIVHWGNVIVNWQTRIGANCRIHPGVCIGELDGATPTIGDGAYLGPGAKIYGGVVLGDNVKVGANAVVNKSFPSNSTLVGVPARALEKTPGGNAEIRNQKPWGNSEIRNQKSE